MKDLKANQIYNVVKNVPFGVRNGSLYVDTGDYCSRIEDREAILKICSHFTAHDQAYLSDSALKDTVNRLKNTPNLQIEFAEETYQNYINIRNGVFDVEKRTLTTEKTNLKFSYVADFEYKSGVTIEDAPVFNNFVTSVFPEETEVKTKLLLEILGYAISDYQTAKAGFFFIGASNSGKSTLLEVVKKLLPEKSVTAIPLHRLTNRFNIARLDGARMNICSEINEKSFAALDLFKQMTSNEVVTAEHKCQTPFEFRLKCKSLNAGNMLPQISALEGMDAILNRMVILYFPVSVDKGKQDKKLVDKLYEERNQIFSMAVDALVKLKDNNFIFTEPKDTETLKAQLCSESTVFEDFIKDCCEIGKKNEIHISRLYQAFSLYCEDNLVEAKYSKRQFSQKIYKMPEVKREKKRINNSKPLWAAIGITLKSEDM